MDELENYNPSLVLSENSSTFSVQHEFFTMTNPSPNKINGSFTLHVFQLHRKKKNQQHKSLHTHSTSPLANLCCILNNCHSNQGNMSNEFLSQLKALF